MAAWPWVSRTVLAVTERAHATEVALLREALASERTRAEALRAELAAMTTTLLAPKATIAPKPRDPVADAIRQRANGDGRLMRHLSTWAMSRRSEGDDDDAIIDRVLHWQSVSDDVGLPV